RISLAAASSRIRAAAAVAAAIGCIGYTTGNTATKNGISFQGGKLPPSFWQFLFGNHEVAAGLLDNFLRLEPAHITKRRIDHLIVVFLLFHDRGIVVISPMYH